MKTESYRHRFVAVVGLCAAVVVAAVVGGAAQGPKATLDDLLIRLRSIERKVDVITIQSSVWEEACIGIGVQCSGPHSTDPASSANHNPVAIRFQVLRSGQPVQGLTSATVLVNAASFPASGPGLQRCDEVPMCTLFPDANFQEAGDGLYVLWMHPFDDGVSTPTWKAGSYMLTLRVTDADGLQGYGIAEIEIAN